MVEPAQEQGDDRQRLGARIDQPPHRQRQREHQQQQRQQRRDRDRDPLGIGAADQRPAAAGSARRAAGRPAATSGCWRRHGPGRADTGEGRTSPARRAGRGPAPSAYCRRYRRSAKPWIGLQRLTMMNADVDQPGSDQRSTANGGRTGRPPCLQRCKPSSVIRPPRQNLALCPSGEPLESKPMIQSALNRSIPSAAPSLLQLLRYALAGWRSRWPSPAAIGRSPNLLHVDPMVS